MSATIFNLWSELLNFDEVLVAVSVLVLDYSYK
jgi:hypothetical protein